MRKKIVLAVLISFIAIGLGYLQFYNPKISEITINDHKILKSLNAAREISSFDEVFREVDEVCIANEIDISTPDKRNCKTSGQVVALVKGNNCEVISLAKLQTRVLLSENTFECRKPSEGFRIVIHKTELYEVVDFD